MNAIARMALVTAFALLGAAPAPGQAQSGPTAGPVGLGATRQALEARAASQEQAAQTTALSKDARADAAHDAERIRHRLAEGDFKVGDRIFLVVEGEKELTDTFPVGLGCVLTLPVIGDVPLAGVLRSELQSYLTHRLAQNLRNPEVRAQAYVRLSIQGSVARPGYYGVPADALLSDAMMVAGGTMQEADLPQLRIERNGVPIWQGKQLQQALAEGRTVDEAGLIAGDEFVVPHRSTTSFGDVLRFTVFLITIPVTVYELTRIF